MILDTTPIFRLPITMRMYDFSQYNLKLLQNSPLRERVPPSVTANHRPRRLWRGAQDPSDGGIFVVDHLRRPGVSLRVTRPGSIAALQRWPDDTGTTETETQP